VRKKEINSECGFKRRAPKNSEALIYLMV